MSKKPSVLDRHLWSDSSLRWLEEDMQIAVVEQLNKLERHDTFTFAADMNGLKTSRRQAGRAKAAGMRAGEPDLRFYFNDGRIGFIEMKTKRGSVSPSQKKRHALLKSLGHDVRVVKASCPQDAIDKVLPIVNEWLS